MSQKQKLNGVSIITFEVMVLSLLVGYKAGSFNAVFFAFIAIACVIYLVATSVAMELFAALIGTFWAAIVGWGMSSSAGVIATAVTILVVFVLAAGFHLQGFMELRAGLGSSRSAAEDEPEFDRPMPLPPKAKESVEKKLRTMQRLSS